MKPYFFLISLFLMINSNVAFSQVANPGVPAELYYPSIRISTKLAESLFHDSKQTLLNCPLLFSGSWSYPDGFSVSMCDDAQLACIRYGLIVQKMKTAKGKLLEELKQTFALEQTEVGLRLRGCQLILEATAIEGKNLQESSGYAFGYTPSTRGQ